MSPAHWAVAIISADPITATIAIAPLSGIIPLFATKPRTCSRAPCPRAPGKAY